VSPAEFDVAVIGAGDIGAAIARELSRFELRVALIDKGDVGAGTSKANTAILHSGFDCRPGTLEARLVARGHELLLGYAAEVGIPIEKTGALMVAWNEAELARMEEVQASAYACGYKRARPIGIDDLYRREPALATGAFGALEVPDEFIVCPWTPPLAYATQAVLAGCTLRRGVEVAGLADASVHDGSGGWQLTLSDGSELKTEWVVNAAGLYSDVVHRLAGGGGGGGGRPPPPRRGELIVFDKFARPLVNHILLPIPTGKTKGVLIAPTVFGNVMLGPTADDLDDKTATGSTIDGIGRLRALGLRLMPRLLEHEVTAVYAGLRAATQHPDYVLEVDGDARYVCAGGIRSTGLTSAMAVAEWVRDGLGDAGLELRERDEALPEITMPNIGEAFPRPYMRPEAVALDPTYGEIVCFCERVTRGEIRDALAGVIPATDPDGLRRRTRALAGRCQGFFCAAQVDELLEERSAPIEDGAQHLGQGPRS
jgi:glycerol-3-phosphate dehydrogenase